MVWQRREISAVARRGLRQRRPRILARLLLLLLLVAHLAGGERAHSPYALAALGHAPAPAASGLGGKQRTDAGTRSSKSSKGASMAGEVEET